jgi:TPR repeat protein
VLEEGQYSRHQRRVVEDWRSAGKTTTARMAEQRLRLRAERGKEGLRDKLVQVDQQQRDLRDLCERVAREQAAVRVAELEAKAAISRHCSQIRRSLGTGEHEARSVVARAEADERELLERRGRAATVRREALADAVAHGAAALSVPDGTDFIARSLSAIALLDAELAVPPGEAHMAVGEAVAVPTIRDLLRGSQPLTSDVEMPAVVQGRLACDEAKLAATAAAAVQCIDAMALPGAPLTTDGTIRTHVPAVTMPPPCASTGDRRHSGGLAGDALFPAALPEGGATVEGSLAMGLRDELTVMRQEASGGDPDALYRLGCCLQHGLGTERGAADLGGAMEYYRAAAEQEHAASQFALGHCLQAQGSGDESSLVWFRRASANGHAQAQCALACCLLSGDTDAVGGSDPMELEIEAVRLFSAAVAADPPLIEAQYNLATCYVAGTGGVRDLAKARELYLAAATAGDAAAQCALGDLLAGYANGSVARGAETADAAAGGEVVVELEEACRWWAQAAEGGIGLAALRLGSVAEDRADFGTAKEWYMAAADAQPPVSGLHEALDRVTALLIGAR